MARNNCRPVPSLSQADIDRFCSKIDIRTSDECWPWKGRTNEDGYGVFDIANGVRGGWAFPSHRVAYFIAYKDNPGALLVCHACDNPPCCNPAHLFKGEDLDNNQDRHAKGRTVMPEHDGTWHAAMEQQRGEGHPSHRLTADEVTEIRALRATGKWTYEQLATKFSIHWTTASHIVNRRLWKHIP